MRDEAMARNVEWVLGEEGRGGRIMLWAHNGHIYRSRSIIEGQVPMGWHLRRSLGADYLAIGFSFNQGSFQARNKLPRGALRSFTVGPAPVDSADAVFSRIGLPILALDLRSAAANPVAGPWVRNRVTLRCVGAVHGEDWPDEFMSVIPSDAFDGMVFFETTTRAIPLTQPIATTP